MNSILQRNRRMRKIAEQTKQKWEKATIHSLDGDRANIRLGSSPNVMRNIEIAGDGSLLLPGAEVVIVWKDRRPVVVPNSAAALNAAQSGDLPMSEVPTCKVINSAAVSVANAAPLVLTFDTVSMDTGGYFDPAAPDRITIWEDGLYMIFSEVAWASNATNLRRARIMLNGELEIARNAVNGVAGGSVTSQGCFAIEVLSAGDYVQSEVWQGSGVALATFPVAGHSPLLCAMQLKNLTNASQVTQQTIVQSTGGGSGELTAHAATHQNGGTDQINVAGLSGLLATPQTPAAHTHSSSWGANVVMGDGVNVLSTGFKCFVEIPYDCTLQAVRLLGDVSGSAVVDIWKGSYAVLPTSANSICSATKPTLASAQVYQDTTLSGWTVSFAKGDILGINVVSAATLKLLTLSLTGSRTV